MGWLVGKGAAVLRTQVSKRSVQRYHHLFDILLSAKVCWTEKVREIIVWMTRIQCCNKVSKGPATGYLAERPKRACAG